jgi:DNA-binding NtrC family response regulator
MTPLFPTRNPQAKRLAQDLARFAPTSLPLLLEGETGTGKNFLARRIHRRSRPGKPFVVVDCAAIPETLLPAELFGHTAAAFTDAGGARRGRLALAGQGTLVLDRVDALSPASQAILLRVLEEGSFFPLGSLRPQPFAARVIALTGPQLAARVNQGLFRQDLYHRLAGFHAQLLPLRERPEDILPAAQGFLAKKAKGVSLSPEAQRLLIAYPWPGNFRELEAVLTRAILQGKGEFLGVAELSLPLASWETLLPHLHQKGCSLAEASKLYALFVLAAEGGNVSRAAKFLGVSRRTLIRWRQGL